MGIFKENLKAILRNTNLSVKEIAAAAGVKKRTIDNWVSPGETNPNALDLQKICEVLNINMEYLLTGKPPGGLSEKAYLIARKIDKLSPAGKEEIDFIVEQKITWAEKTKELKENYSIPATFKPVDKKTEKRSEKEGKKIIKNIKHLR